MNDKAIAVVKKYLDLVQKMPMPGDVYAANILKQILEELE